MAPEVLQLTQDAQVMLIKNCDGELVNGSMGRIVGFVDPSEYTDRTAHEARLDNTNVNADPSGSTPEEADQKWPLVEFVVPGGKREAMITPETWRVELPSGKVQASRTQASP